LEDGPVPYIGGRPLSGARPATRAHRFRGHERSMESSSLSIKAAQEFACTGVHVGAPYTSSDGLPQWLASTGPNAL